MIPDPSDHDAFKKNLIILDDIMLGPQNKEEAYFKRGRHNTIDVTDKRSEKMVTSSCCSHKIGKILYILSMIIAVVIFFHSIYFVSSATM